MASQDPISFKPIVDAIESAEEALRALPAPENEAQAAERSRVQTGLEGAKQVVKALCFSADPANHFIPVHALPEQK